MKSFRKETKKKKLYHIICWFEE